MDNLNQNNGSLQHRGVLNGQQGTWVPVESESVPFQVSNDPAHPSMAQDGNYYYAQGGAPQSANGFGPIQANQFNAIPTPSNIVQLPPIVQPIALVPFASQNQPLVQYDPNYREEIPQTNLEPIYRAKPYSGLSVLCILLAVAAIVVASLIECISVGATALDSVFGLLVKFGVGSFTSHYYDALLAGETVAITAYIVPVAYLVSMVLALVMVIYYLIKLAKRQFPRHFSVVTLIALIAAAVATVIEFITDGMEPAIGAYVMLGVLVVLLIAPLFARKGAQVIDYSASKRLYGDNK